jgi:hypothetical protein
MLEQSRSGTLSKTKRLRILTPTEMDDLYLCPEFTEEERIWLFELNESEQKILTFNISNASKVDAIIRLGYFKKKQQFFSFNLDKVQADVGHVLQRYFDPPVLDKNTIGREAKRKNQQWVLRITGHTLFDQKKHGQILLNKAEKLCRLSVNPVFIFQELLTELTQKKVTRPEYSTLQKIISCALVSEQKRISQIFKEHLSTLERSQLLSLFNQEENFYAITLLKQQPKNFG